MLILKQSTAYTLKIGPFIDDTDGKTAEVALTLGSSDIRVSKNGANIAGKNSTASCTHDELGYYDCPISTTDTNTVGKLQLFVHESGALPVFHEYQVVNAHVYNSLFSSSGTDNLEVDAILISGSSAPSVIADMASSAISGGVDLSTTALDAVKNRASTALEIYDLDHFIQVTAGAEKPTIGSYLDSIFNSSSSQTFDRSTDSLQAMRDQGDAAWITGSTVVDVSSTSLEQIADTIADEVVDESDHVTKDTIGYHIKKLAYILGHVKMNITDATGAIAVRNAADAANYFTGSVTDNSVTTTRTALSS